MGTRRPARGFTLVELLVALFALSLLAVLSWRGLDGMTRAQALTETRADEVLALQTGLAQWNADLDALLQLPQLTALDWNGRVLRLTRRSGASVTGTRSARVFRARLRLPRWSSHATLPCKRPDSRALWRAARAWVRRSRSRWVRARV